VDETLRVLGAQRIWALGDCATADQDALAQAGRLAARLRGRY
jgi:NADH dehydrogenase FAD-containing subunit